MGNATNAFYVCQFLLKHKNNSPPPQKKLPPTIKEKFEKIKSLTVVLPLYKLILVIYKKVNKKLTKPLP